MYAIALWLALVLAWYLLVGRNNGIAFATVVLAWILMNPWWGGNPRILRSVERGPIHGEAIIPWSTTSITYPEVVVTAKSEQEVIEAVRKYNGIVPLGSGHSFANLFTSSHVILLDYCEMNIDNMTITVSGGCKIDKVRSYAYKEGYVLRGLGAIYQQSVGGGLATSLHNDEKKRFKDWVRNVTYINAVRNGEAERITTENASTVDGTTGSFIFLTVTIEMEKEFNVKRSTEMAGWDAVESVLEQVRNDSAESGGAQIILPRGGPSPLGPAGKWLVWKTVRGAGQSSRSREENLPAGAGREENLPAAAAAAAVPAAYVAFVLDNVITPLLTYAPWVLAVPAWGGGGTHDPFVHPTDEHGIIEWYKAQEHHPGSVLPTGEIRAADCKQLVDALANIAADYGELTLVIRPAEEGCWVDYAVFPWAEGATLRFHTEVAKAAVANATSDWFFHRGKIDVRPAAPADKPAGQLSREDGYLVILEFQRIFWIVIVTGFVSVFASTALYT